MRIAVITGAAKGLGYEVARQLSGQGYQVVLTGRDAAALAAAAGTLGQGAVWHRLDVSDDASVDSFFAWLEATHGRLDVLVNSAGRLYGSHASRVVGTDAANVLAAVDNNALGALRMMSRALPLMARGGYGRIVNVSSGMGALTGMGSGAVAYRVSKTALNALTILAAHEAAPGIKVNAVCPGWVRTDMGGPSASRDVASGASGIVWAASLAEDGPSGGFFRDGKPIPW